MSWKGWATAVLVPTAVLTTLRLASPQAAHGGQDDGPRKVLITNDDGIDAASLRALARAFAGATETVVVAPLENRSGSSTSIAALRSGRLVVERRGLDAGVAAYAVDGEPGDAVIFALTTLLADDPPDLVISGINGGPNLGDAWIASGTIGAARLAAYLGVPAIAVSGLPEDGDSGAVAALADWVVQLAHSPLARRLEAPEYLTVSLPPLPPERIEGLELTDRARGTLRFALERTAEAGDGDREVWRLRVSAGTPDAPGTDATALRSGRIAIVPMRADEFEPDLKSRLEPLRGAIPLPGRKAPEGLRR